MIFGSLSLLIRITWPVQRNWAAIRRASMPDVLQIWSTSVLRRLSCHRTCAHSRHRKIESEMILAWCNVTFKTCNARCCAALVQTLVVLYPRSCAQSARVKGRLAAADCSWRRRQRCVCVCVVYWMRLNGCDFSSRVDLSSTYWSVRLTSMRVRGSDRALRSAVTCPCDTRQRYNTNCYSNVQSKADRSQLNLPHGTDD